jgi:hypothetical protein
LVVGSVGGGMAVDEVMHEYRLTRAQVLAALTYSAEIVGEERLVPLLPSGHLVSVRPGGYRKHRIRV